MALQKLYTLVDDRFPGDYIAQSESADKFPEQFSPDVHLEIWYYDGAFFVYKERIEG